MVDECGLQVTVKVRHRHCSARAEGGTTTTTGPEVGRRRTAARGRRGELGRGGRGRLHRVGHAAGRGEGRRLECLALPLKVLDNLGDLCGPRVRYVGRVAARRVPQQRVGAGQAADVVRTVRVDGRGAVLVEQQMVRAHLVLLHYMVDLRVQGQAIDQIHVHIAQQIVAVRSVAANTTTPDSP